MLDKRTLTIATPVPYPGAGRCACPGTLAVTAAAALLLSYAAGAIVLLAGAGGVFLPYRLGSLLKVLGVELGASQKGTDTAYKRKAKTYHPDRVASLAPEVREMTELRMKEINAAYTELRRRSH